MGMDRSALEIVIDLEARKLGRATVVRVATAAALVLVMATTAGGYAAAMHAGDTDLGRKAASMVTSPGWGGYTALGATSMSATILLAVGVVMSWSTGREFTDGTIVGLFAIPPALRTIATAKMLVTLSWAVLLGAGEAVLLMTAGLLLGLGVAGATGCFATLLLVSVVLSAGVLPVMWAATRWRGYLAGIGLTLAILVVTNLAAGFGLGTYTPWSIPVAWTMNHDDVSTWLLVVPVMTAAIGAWVTLRSWDRLQLGTDGPQFPWNNCYDEEAAGCWAAARMGAPFSGGSPWPTTAPPFMSKATTSES